MANALITPSLAENIDVSFSILVGCILTVVSVLASLFLTAVD